MTETEMIIHLAAKGVVASLRLESATTDDRLESLVQDKLAKAFEQFADGVKGMSP
jgi:hypothetical protein